MITDFAPGDRTGDALRVHRAQEHCRGVAAGVLSVHAVAMARGTEGVLLFGGYGAGKSVTGLALAARGWRAVAGDVALMLAGRNTLVGGSRRFLLRPSSPAAHGLAQASANAVPRPATRIDATARVPWVAVGTEAIRARLAMNVTVDSGAGPSAHVADLDEHTSLSVWWRASGYLLDRVLTDPSAAPLRSMECPELAAERMRLVRSAARLQPVREAYGTADAIAEAIDLELTEE
ncbi:hypothetical protein KGQ19_12840 [Catenulispora sp. NL8]|uniref:HPr kinase n=1 Tax=Catenulispora pinistramenti TaxID=2705254 RepID=A0ABS5KNY9_9ACTN|nr:hypothetical protein [Catenulispora pinistramenti]MBS2547754.1 hypothetical protein [Catenulispora pinistramenti]